MSATTEVPTGNTYDKYGSTNPVVKRLMASFHATLDELWELAAPGSVLDVGCGEGVLTVEWADRLGDGRVVGIDLDDPKLRAEWDKRSRPNLEFRAEVYNLTNTPLFANPGANYNLGNFGQISSPALSGFGLYGFTGREVQFSARILF